MHLTERVPHEDTYLLRVVEEVVDVLEGGHDGIVVALLSNKPTHHFNFYTIIHTIKN